MTDLRSPIARFSSPLFLAASLYGPGVVLAQTAKITVGKNVMVSAASPGWEHAEYTADADPADGGRAMVCSMRFSQARNQLTSVAYATFDGGATWSVALEDSSSRFQGIWDPACGYGVNRQAILVTLSLPDTAFSDTTAYAKYQWWRHGGDGMMHVFRSPDGGRTWGPSIPLSFIDYESLTVDRTNSPYRGRMYIYGNTNGGAHEAGTWLIYSSDSGRTWVRSERTDDEEDYYSRTGTVLPSGTLLLPLNNTPGGLLRGGRSDTSKVWLAVAASRDGGVHIDRSVKVTQYRTNRACSHPLGIGMASDHSNGPMRGRAYIVWADESSGRCLPFVAWSDDQGKTWSKPVLVSDARPRSSGVKPTEHILAKIAVNPAGAVGVSWYDPGNDTTNQNLKLRFAASLDGGETWQPSVQVSTFGFVATDPPTLAAHTITSGGGGRRNRNPTDAITVSAIPSARAYYQWNSGPGDYSGIAAGADGAFHTFWIDNRSGVGEMYTARVTVDGTVINPDSALAPLKNITTAIEMQYTASIWEPKARTLTWEYRLLNTSKDTIIGPVKLRVTGLTSNLGVPFLMLDRPTRGAGTVIEVADLVPASGLLPGQLTASRRLVVRLDSYENMLGAGQRDLVEMTVKIYGTRRAGAKKP